MSSCPGFYEQISAMSSLEPLSRSEASVAAAAEAPKPSKPLTRAQRAAVIPDMPGGGGGSTREDGLATHQTVPLNVPPGNLDNGPDAEDTGPPGARGPMRVSETHPLRLHPYHALEQHRPRSVV